MKIEMTEFEYLNLFGDNKGKQFHNRDFTLNGEKFIAVEWHISTAPCSFYEAPQKEISLVLVKPMIVKSPQELSAEESVKKAEEALRAAKEVLNKVKEK